MRYSNKQRHLWAPWRIEYILSSKTDKCFLCDREQANPNKKDDFMIIARGEKSFIMLNAFPYNSGHLLISPYKHTGDIAKLEKETLYEMTDFMVKAKTVLQKVLKPEGFNAGYNWGLPAGAGLEDHLHMHIVPRWTGDTNFMSVLDNTRVIPQALKDTADILKNEFNK